jgi:transposase-like protein
MLPKNCRYSEAFKQQVIMEIESGRFASAAEASKAYGIGGRGTVAAWLRAAGRGELLRKVVRVEKPGEPGEIARLKERVRELESALADACIDGALAESYFELLCERTNTDIEAFKKNTVGRDARYAAESGRAEGGECRARLRPGGYDASELLQDEEVAGAEGRRR